ncbi:LuxR family maltose regulon positive regulatory protein [Crossiella equi]|uniref:LuxR family maltose regulon positive regulatory protein n=1 Tax=Crossiella equi TaxID=130796 RepID=A0ABS5ASG7_9PSEU|nr:LuxR C-terminal-related transcriptional regulator [Crossiella equi]MBP2479527.1 LuxR family maltose regulon positive regulatory protein [Crossiella equi]
MLDWHLTSAAASVLVLTAPAGTGKSVLLRSWSRERDGHDALPPVHLVTVTERDNEPGALVDRIAPVLRDSGEPRCLALDELHLLTAPAALRELSLLVHQPPPGLRLVLATRPPLPLELAGMRVTGQLAELSAADLAFTTEEATELLAANGMSLTSAETRDVLRRSGGWGVGVRLLATAVTERSGSAARALAGYLDKEVLAVLPPADLEFLRAASVCERVNPELASALTETAGAGPVLERLAAETGLVLPTDEHGWFRCQPLVRAHLLAELGRTQPGRRAELHRLACTWFGSHGTATSALAHALEAGETEPAARLVADAGLAELYAGRGRQLRELVSRLPLHVSARPAVVLVSVLASLAAGDLTTAERGLRLLSARELVSPRPWVLAASARLWHGALTRAPESGHRISGETGDAEVDLLACLVQGGTLLWQGQAQAADRSLTRARQLAETGDRPAALLPVLAHQAVAEAARGQAAAPVLARRAISLAEDRGWTASTSCGLARFLLAVQAHLRLAPHTAYGLAATVPAADPALVLAVRALRAVLRFDAGTDPHRAVTELRQRWWEAERVAPPPPLFTAWLAPTAMRMALRSGELGWAREIAEHTARRLAARGEALLLRALLCCHGGRLNTARKQLVPLLTGRCTPVLVHTLVEAWLVEAMLAQRMRAEGQAHRALLRALAAAEGGELLRPFHQTGPEIRELLVRGHGRFGKLARFADRVLAASPTLPPAITDSLTSRELDLLAELPSMRTAEEIAESLYLSVNTVKTHLRGIYRKLGVNARRDAVIAARRCGLL